LRDVAVSESSRYAEASIPVLEDYLKKQFAGEAPTSFEANLALLKLYQFYPHRANVEFIGKSLLIALLAFSQERSSVFFFST
jgi:hypothetical protein